MAYGTISSPTGSTGAPSGLESQPQQQLSLGHDEASTLTAEDSGNGQNSSQTIDHGTPSTTLWVRARGFYDANIGLFFVFLAQMCGSIMSLTTRVLETGFETKFHALQIVFVRMLATATLGSAYLWYKKVPGFPFGPHGVRWLLIIRGISGTSGLIAAYYALSILDISDATVISFLVPTLTAIVCWIVLREPFTIREALASAIAFTGVLFVARPSFLFPIHDPVSKNLTQHLEMIYSTVMINTGGGIIPPVPVTPSQRSWAVFWAIFGSFGAALAYATIRVIGKRTHSLVSVNYFAVLATVVSFLGLILHPDLSFKMPQTIVQWLLLISIGISGFLLQVLLTEGLQREKAGRATNMIYIQLVFALIFERIVWGTTPPVESFIGSALIIGAAIWITIQKKDTTVVTPASIPDEESRLLGQDENDSNR